MPACRNRRGAPFLFPFFVALCLLTSPVAGLAARREPSANMPASRKESQQLARDIVRRGDKLIVSRQFVDEVRKKNEIILSTVAIKARVDEGGQLQGYQLVQINRGSAIERMGFKQKDILTGVNGMAARDFEANRPSLETADRFDVTILRNGRERKIRIEIR